MPENGKNYVSKEYYPVLDIVKFALALIIIFHNYQQCIFTVRDYREEYYRVSLLGIHTS